MNNIYFLVISILLGVAAAISFFSYCSYYLKKAYFNLITTNKKKELDAKITNWWESSISKNPISIFKLSLQSVLNVFLKNGKPDIIKILFFSYAFTLSSLFAGYFFSDIGNYLSIYWHFPVDVEASSTLMNNIGQTITDKNVLSEFRSHFILKDKTDFFANVVYFLSSLVNVIICYKGWKRVNDFKIVFAFIIVTELLCLIFKPLTVLTDVIAGLYETSSNDYLWLPIINILILTLFRKQIFKTCTLRTCIIWFFSILLLNFIVWRALSYNSFEYIIDTYLVDGICNRYIAFYLINFIFDFFTFRIIFKYINVIQKKSSFALIYYLIITLFTTAVASCLTFLFYTFYIFIVQNAIPEFAEQPIMANMSFWGYVESTTVTEFIDGEYTFFFYAFSTLIPFLIFLAYSFSLILMRIFKKLSSYLLFYIYILSNPSNISIIPFYLISLFISFLVLIGAAHITYITFLGFYK